MILGTISKQNHQPVVVLIGGEVTESLWLQDLCTTLFSCCHAVKLTSWIVNLWEFERFLGESPCHFGSNKRPVYQSHHVLPFDVPISDDYTSLHTCFNTTEINTGKFFYHKSSASFKTKWRQPEHVFVVGYPVDDPFIPIHSFHTVDSSEIRRSPPGMYGNPQTKNGRFNDKQLPTSDFWTINSSSSLPLEKNQVCWAPQTKWWLPRRYSTRCQGLKRTSCHVMSAWWVWKWLATVSPPRRCYQYGVVSAHCSEHTDILLDMNLTHYTQSNI